MHACCALVIAVALPAAALAADTVKKAPDTKAAPAATAKAAPAATSAQTAAPAMDPTMKAQMEQMEKLAQPGAEHAWLKTMEGKWKAVTKSWMGPGDPVVTEGTSDNQMVLGGRYLQSHYVGSMMGKPFEGWGLTGFDNTKKQYSSFWVDNASTAMMVSSGTMSGKDLTTTTMMDGPDGKPTQVRMVTSVLDDKTHTFTMYVPQGGKDQKWMEITYTRQ
jgi:hypothetical protein